MAQGQSLYLWSSKPSGTPPVLTYWSFDVWHLCIDGNHAEAILTAEPVLRMSERRHSHRVPVPCTELWTCTEQTAYLWLSSQCCSSAGPGLRWCHTAFAYLWIPLSARLIFFSSFMESFPISQVSEILPSSSQQKFSQVGNLPTIGACHRPNKPH